jgi:hypothetical protein
LAPTPDEQHHAEQTKEINDRLTACERNVGDIKRELADGVTKRIDELEITYWGHRETDKHHRAEQTKQMTEKLTVFERHVDDVSHELKEVRGDLARATDTAHQIHLTEMRLDERRIAADEAKRGRKGEVGPRGPKGERGLVGLPGKDGKDGKDGGLVSIKKWEINAPQFTARAILTNGERTPALPLRGLFEEYQRQVGE